MSDYEEDIPEEQQEEEQEENDFEKGSRPEDGTVHYGNIIFLKHDATGKYLTSVDGENYEEGSGQQKVFTGDDDGDDSVFLVVPIAGQEDQMSYQVGFDDQFRLQHVSTGRFLHSHPDIESPVTSQQEVTAFGSEEESDENDIWQLQAFPDHEYDPEDYLWHLDIPIVIRHVMTGQTLHSHEEAIDDDHFEVTGYVGTDDNDKWQAV
ncbi:MIR motif-containing protein [Phascolomyces articulosus]|uniref:MIR motif-containing protein n=1 Tax=Phascolomyces articulosus TaxID=60185 RepID=A0AAD5JYY5_9FUNG|nr:MIR motif-containing protein [Phascolomyces articulosus]